jgi:hypothetical protein
MVRDTTNISQTQIGTNVGLLIGDVRCHKIRHLAAKTASAYYF